MGSEVLQVAARQFFVWRFFIIRRSSIDEALAHARDQERVALAKPKKKASSADGFFFRQSESTA